MYRVSACIKMNGISLKRRFIWRFLFHFTRHTLSAPNFSHSALSIGKWIFVHAYTAWTSLSHQDESFSATATHTIYHWTEQNGRSKKKTTTKSLKRGKKFDDRPLHTSISKKVKQSNLLSFCVDMIRMCVCVVCARGCLCVWQLPFSVYWCVYVVRMILFFILAVSRFFCIHTITNTLIFHRRSVEKESKRNGFCFSSEIRRLKWYLF